MKCVFFATTALILLLALSACSMGTIEEAVFTFVNNRTDYSVRVEPTDGTGQDWSAITIAVGETETVESENGTIQFNAYVGTSTTDTAYYTQDGKTYTFSDE